MTTTYAGYTPEQIRAAAEATKDIIRSHGWDGTVEMGDHMGKDEAFMKLANPATVLALLDRVEELERQLSASEDATELIKADATIASLLHWLAEARFAVGDDGKRMLPEFVEYLKEMARDAARYRWLRSDDIEVLPGAPEILVMKMPRHFMDESEEILLESECDSDIDAAMEKTNVQR